MAPGGPQLHSPGVRSQADGVNRRATPRPEVLPWRPGLAGTSVCERSRVTWEQPPGPPSALVTALQVPLARATVWLTHLLKRPAFLHLVPALDLLRICSLPSSGREENPRGCWPPPGSSADCQHSGFSYSSCSQLPRKGWEPPPWENPDNLCSVQNRLHRIPLLFERFDQSRKQVTGSALYCRARMPQTL